MQDPHPSSLAERFVHDLLACGDPNRADALVFDAQEHLAPTAAAALWRRVRRPGDGPAWSLVRSRGDLDRLPPEVTVRALLEGTLPADLLGEGRLLRSGSGDAALALVRADDLDDPELQGALEALLEVRQAVGDDPGEAPGPLASGG